jgi:hypothetical protein
MRQYPSVPILSVGLALLLILAFTVATPPPTASAQTACYSLTLYQHPYAGVLASPAPNCGGTSYTAGSVVSVRVQYASCMRFVGWTYDASGTANPISVVMDRSKTIGVALERIGYWC